MIRVNNKKIITVLSLKSLKANKNRNIMAVLAIMLTTILFTALFTIAGTLLNSFEQANFRQAGGNFHGTFKNVTKEQIAKLTQDERIMSSGSRKMLGMPTDEPFQKTHVEVSYMDENCIKSSFCTPTQGTLPQEGTDEIACDTRILELLGVTPQIGQKVTLSYYIGPYGEQQLVTDTFTLSGWWEYDEAGMASQAVVPLSYVDHVLVGYERADKNDITGRWDLNIFLKSASHIREDMDAVLEQAGYQSEDERAENYIGVGVNWGYTGAQLSGNMDTGTMIALFGLLFIIMFTGYLIIYNIFQISVANDIRFYGLLKTIGTTGRQIKVLIHKQALLLAAVGIPVGLVIGYVCGNILVPLVMSASSYQTVYTTLNPWIFIGAAAFSLITVLISCRKPGKTAARVSPIEAVRYTEAESMKQSTRKGSSRINILHMAAANLKRSKKRTILVVLSMALAVLLFQITVTFSNGFDMDKYLAQWVVTDFILADADYFQMRMSGTGNVVTEEDIQTIDQSGDITNSGRIYQSEQLVQQLVTKEWFWDKNKKYVDESQKEQYMGLQETNEEGSVADHAQLYGMEELLLDRLTLIDGDLAPLYDKSQNAIAAVYLTDDYDNVHPDSNWAKVGDTVTMRYVEEWEYLDAITGEKVENPESSKNGTKLHAVKYAQKEYTVAACVTMKHAMGFRQYSSEQFVLNAAVFNQDVSQSSIMSYLFDTNKESNAEMEQFLNKYTQQMNTALDYESKQSYVNEFNEFRDMFFIIGSVLSVMVGLIGILNFFNAILTSIMTRRREFAMLQSIGMTGRQLKRMLVYEGICYALLTAAVSCLLTMLTAPLMQNALGSMFWFFTYRFQAWSLLVGIPIFLLAGILLPMAVYHSISEQTIVERLRTIE